MIQLDAGTLLGREGNRQQLWAPRANNHHQPPTTIPAQVWSQTPNSSCPDHQFVHCISHMGTLNFSSQAPGHPPGKPRESGAIPKVQMHKISTDPTIFTFRERSHKRVEIDFQWASFLCRAEEQLLALLPAAWSLPPNRAWLSSQLPPADGARRHFYKASQSLLSLLPDRLPNTIAATNLLLQ